MGSRQSGIDLEGLVQNMEMFGNSKVEQSFFSRSEREEVTSKLPYIVVPNFPSLGLMTALRFLEWVAENPEGVVSLPTGKTPEYFIKWTQHFLENWEDKKAQSIMRQKGLELSRKPSLKGLHFVQIDEFYPISPQQHNSFYYYVNRFYLDGLGMDRSKALLINSDEIQLAKGKHYSEVFPEGRIDLGLRHREATNGLEKLQQESILRIDDWCAHYERSIRDLGGIGFFLGGIGPDGHIAFNTRGSDHFCTTRLTQTNFETQAASATDLGGIEVSRSRLVITIGLGTITRKKDGVSIIFAAGEAKAPIVRDALESEPQNRFPATALQSQPNARFYITKGASLKLLDSQREFFREGDWNFQKTERAIWELCRKRNTYAQDLTMSMLEKDEFCAMIPELSLEKVQEVVDSAKKKIAFGTVKEDGMTYLHTGPHHDDIMLGIFPNITRQLREPSNRFHFAVLTSGFTAVTNRMMNYLLGLTEQLVQQGQIHMLQDPEFFAKGYREDRDRDVNEFLNQVAAKDEAGKLRALCHRITRSVAEVCRVGSMPHLMTTLESVRNELANSYDGQKNPPHIQKLKGMLREYEEELIWAHFGVRVANVEHLRLGFYKGDIFTEKPQPERDVMPILEMFHRVDPDVISVTLDPEGSGPDTHYKVLQATAEALRLWSAEKDLSKLRIIGYRNVWFRFAPWEADVITPVSLNGLAVLDRSFKDCYISQVNASFPSPELDGPFSDLSQRVWVEQFQWAQLILGKEYFIQNERPLLRATRGMVFHKEMGLEEFLGQCRRLSESMELGAETT